MFQISCQFDYDTEADAGLGDNFQPSVKASCVGGTMTVRVDTKKAFEGIIHGPNRLIENLFYKLSINGCHFHCEIGIN